MRLEISSKKRLYLLGHSCVRGRWILQSRRSSKLNPLEKAKYRRVTSVTFAIKEQAKQLVIQNERYQLSKAEHDGQY